MTGYSILACVRVLAEESEKAGVITRRESSNVIEYQKYRLFVRDNSIVLPECKCVHVG